MADNVVITAGTGTTVHADEYTHGTLGSGKTQLVKLVDGTLNSETAITVDVGAKANALRVAPANDITDGTYIGDIKFGEALVAGTALIGKVGIDQVSANANEVVVKSGTVTTVGTVTNITSLDKAVYVDDADWTDNTSSHILVGGVYQSAPHTVTDGDVSPFQLDVNGKIVVSGVTACNTGAVVVASGTVTTVSTVTNLSQMNGTAIAMNEGALAAGVQRVTLATDDDAVAHLSTIATNTVRTPITDYGQAKLDHADVTTARVLVATAGAVKFYITSIILSVTTAGTYWIEDEDAAQITCKFTLAANGGVALSFPQNTPFKSTTANKGLNVKGSAAGVIGCQITYYTAV